MQQQMQAFANQMKQMQAGGQPPAKSSKAKIVPKTE